MRDEHPAARALAGRHRLRPWEPIPWVLALAWYVVFPKHLGFGTEVLVTILFAVSLDLALGYAGVVTCSSPAWWPRPSGSARGSCCCARGA